MILETFKHTDCNFASPAFVMTMLTNRRVEDPRILWPDSASIGFDGYFYMNINQVRNDHSIRNLNFLANLISHSSSTRQIGTSELIYAQSLVPCSDSSSPTTAPRS